jgi:streptogramin lyase
MRSVVLIVVSVAFFAGPSEALAYVGVIGRISTSGQVTEYTAGVPAKPGAITSGPDGNLWFTAARDSADDSAATPASAGSRPRDRSPSSRSD